MGPTNPKLNDVAWTAGEKMRQLLVDGAKQTGGHYSYVNYAYGAEEVEEVYGKENVVRLKKLKRAYDPDNRFRFYAPIMRGEDEKRERDDL